jgi:hypothetical protein
MFALAAILMAYVQGHSKGWAKGKEFAEHFSQTEEG